MAKKVTEVEFNMSKAIREVLQENPKTSSRAAAEAILAKYPSATINKNSFSVAFYTGRKKLGIRLSGGKQRGSTGKSAGKFSTNVDLAMLQSAARFLREAGSAEAAFEAIKQVQAVQVK